MRYLNIFYVFALLVGLLLWRLNVSMNREVVTFYGFAENKETEINFNYSVAVGKIHVSPGQRVKAGTPLLDMYRIKPKETLEDQPYRINELKAKALSWRTEQEGTMRLIESQKQLKLAAINADIQKLKAEKQFQSSLYEGLKSIEKAKETYSPVEQKIKALEEEKGLVIKNFNQKIQNIKEEMRVGINPYQEEIKRLEAEQAFDAANKTIDLQLTAPSDGVIGNIYCKEAEHIPSYKTLVSFYEPNPSLVQGFVQEDLILHVAVNDSFLVRSTKDVTTYCYGVVTGLGSRIVEIPERLRKVPDFKTYGREILIAIPEDNSFLQKEKVILEFVNLPEGYQEKQRRKPLVDLKVNE